MANLDKNEFRDFLQGGVVENTYTNLYTFSNYEDERFDDIGITYDLTTNQFTKLYNINLTSKQLNKIEDKIIDFYTSKKEDLPDLDYEDSYPSHRELYYKFY